MRRTVLLFALLASAVVPASAFAAAPPNDTLAGAVRLTPTYTPGVFPQAIMPVGPLPMGGWTEADTTGEDAALPPPSCLGFAPWHSMWYVINVPEASVLTITLTSTDVTRYQPVVAITGSVGEEYACGLGGSDNRTDPTASASSFVLAGDYVVRIGSVGSQALPIPNEGPTIRLAESLQDVTPPEIQVSVSGKTRIVGPGKPYTFNASKSIDRGSSVNPSSAKWFFSEAGKPTQEEDGSLIASHRWTSEGVHPVTLQLADKSGNVNTYTFSVLVHNFVLPKVGLSLSVPSPGAKMLRIVLSHNVPVRVRLVIMQNGRILRVMPSKLLKGSKKTRLSVALWKKVGKVGFVAVSGTASDLGEAPNTVPLLTCSVDPVNGGGTCG